MVKNELIQDTEEIEAKVFGPLEGKFKAWFNNRMALLLIYIQSNRSLNEKQQIETVFFLKNIEHHFIDCHAPQPVWDAFAYLYEYFGLDMPKEESGKALKMIAAIYAALGMNAKI